MITIKIGGVPEHFNYPWYIGLKNKLYVKEGIDLRWQDFGGGTGAMVKALEEQTIDMAVVLTEGIIKAIVNGNPSKIVQPFVESPLLWGVYAAANSSFKSINDLENATAAISRLGSGSHLMAIVNAYNQGWDIDSLSFKIVKNLQGGIDALTQGEADYFMWEHFTTKPLVDKGIFKHLGDCPTPWPCFVIAVREDVLEQHPQAIKTVLEVTNDITDDFKDIDGIDSILAERYHQKLEDVQKWLSITEWNSTLQVGENLIDTIQNKLLRFGVLKKKATASSLIKKM